MSRAKKNWDRLVKFDGNYGIDIANGIWPGSGLQQKGDVGPKGEVGQKGERGLQGNVGPKGVEGPTGADGPQGDEGPSAFDVAVKGGFIGTETEWLATLQGEKGEVGQQGEKGAFGDLTEDEKDRLKGDQGEQGEKGEASGIFHFKGKESDFTSIEALPGPHEEGDVYQASDTEDLYVWDGTQFVLLSEALSVVKGEKGEEGEDGDDGAKGERGERGFRGQKGIAGEQGEVGDSAYEIAVKGGYSGTEVEWVASLKGGEGEKGETGAKGDQGDSAYEISQKGIDPSLQLDEDEWLESLKGQKGENYDPLVLDDYYSKGQVDQLLDQLPNPDDAYDIHSMPPENIAGPGDVGDFLDEDPSHFLYNPGLVGVKQGANISNSPAAAPFVIRNVVLNNPAGLRGVDYTVMQEVIAISTGNSTSFIRTAQPGSASFSPWSESTFDANSYYNKTEVDGLIGAIDYVLAHEAAKITLTDKDSVEQSVQLIGTNGIVVSSDPAGVVIDGAALTPVPQFLGILQDAQDPATLSPDATSGQYYIIGYTGVTVSTDPDAQACTPGDWVIYDTDKWVFLDISSDPGVVSVSVSGLLEIEDSDLANPVIGLDPTAVVTPDELEAYVEKDDLAKVMTSIFINDLADVEIEYTRVPFGGSASRAVYSLNAGETATPTDGERSSDIETNTLYLAQTSSSGQGSAEFYNNINTAADPPQIIRAVGTGSGIGAGDQRTGRCVSKSSNGSVLTLVFETANIPLFSQGCAGEVTFDIVTEELDHGAILTYDNTSQLWKAGEAADYVKKDGDTMTGELKIDKADLLVTRGDGADLFHVDSTNGNVKSYGQIFEDDHVVNLKHLQDGYLPLTGGVLDPKFGTTPALVLKGSPDYNDDNNIFKVTTSSNGEVLRLLNNKDAIFGANLKADAITLENSLTVSKQGIASTGTFTIKRGDHTRIRFTEGTTTFARLDATSDPSMAISDEHVRIYRTLKIGPGDTGGDANQLLASTGNTTPPEWKSVVDVLDDAGHNFLVKPYTVYTGDLVTDLTPEAPDNNFHDGELWYSTATEELFVYGNGNWWPTSVDWQADITRIDSELSGKLSLTGGEVTGVVTSSASITQNKQLVTKEYVDSNSGGVEVLAGNKSNPAIGDMWFNTSANVMYLRTA